MIEFFHGPCDFLLGDGCQIPLLREVLSDEIISILVQPPLQGGIRMCEVDTGIKVGSHAFMVGNLATIA